MATYNNTVSLQSLRPHYIVLHMQRWKWPGMVAIYASSMVYTTTTHNSWYSSMAALLGLATKDGGEIFTTV